MKGAIKLSRSLLIIMKRLWYYIALLILAAILAVSIVNSKNSPIIIGFSAQLTGRQAELGVQERNGVQLAVEKINEQGGIDGHKLSLVVKDDFGTPDRAKTADEELIKQGAVAIIGHATSSQTEAGLKVTNLAKVVMIGPTVSSPNLRGIDDYFFSVYPSFKSSSQAFAKYIYDRIGLKKMVIIYDKDNFIYSKNYVYTFLDEFESLGGKVSEEVSFSSEAHPDFESLLSKLKESKAEGILIVASDIDTALIAQRIRIMNWQIPMFTSAWAQTGTLITNGGHAVDGMISEQAYIFNSKIQDFSNFQARYEKRFGNEPSFGAAYSYEAMLVLSEALKKTNGRATELKQALLQIHDFKGLIDTFSFDKYGDVERPFYVSIINNGKYANVEVLSPINKSEGVDK